MNLTSSVCTKAFAPLAVCLAFLLPSAHAQTPAPRITVPISNASRVTLAGSRPPRAAASADAGPVAPSLPLHGITLVFSRTAAQQADLDALLTAQQTVGSPLYHQWLNPDQFAARFGVADSDITAVSSWLQLQGFSIDSVSRSHNRIAFSGTAALVASAFGAPLHYYNTPATATHAATRDFAPSADLTIPAALASSVQNIGNLSSFRPHAHLIRSPQSAAAPARPAFTSSSTGNHFITPGDVATIYDITPAYNAGITGVNQTITVLGQSAVALADVAAFQTAANIPGKTPELVLVPNSGNAIFSAGDEGESDLDLEYTSTIAKGAQVFFVYTGDSSNYGVFDSLGYAVDEKLTPIISSSYGDCETDLGASYYTQFNAILQQAAAQGQTVVSAAGDAGSTDCYGISDTTITTLAQQEALVVDFPASSQYVTAMGGTEFPAADVASGNNQYFTAAGTTDVISSAVSYIPEQVWNDDAVNLAAGSTSPLSSGGGGASIFTARPTWQTGTIGGVAIPSGSYRLLPDISLDASPNNAPFAYCSSDTTYWSSGQESSCTSGFRDSSTGDLTIAGGTSFDAPIFSGMLALINQSLNSTGQGVINPTLYTLAAASATYGSAFHDITSGGNQCDAGSAYCSSAGAGSYAAVTGYDEASGLGSIDLYNLLTAWPQITASSLAATVTTLSPATNAPAPSASDVITITVGPVTGSAVPTGSVALSIDDATPISIPLVNGIGSYTFTSAIQGAHVLTATYSGDATNAPSTTSLALNVAVPPVGSFTLAAPAVSVTAGSSVTATATITPTGGYTGDVVFSYSADIPNACVTGNSDVEITGTAPATEAVTFYTSAATCNQLGLSTLDKAGSGGKRILLKRASNSALRTNLAPTPHKNPWRNVPLPVALAGTLLMLGFGRRSGIRRNVLRAGISLSLLLALSLGGLCLTGCSSSASAPQSVINATDTPAGTYTFTLYGTDSVNTTQTSSVNITLTVN